MSEVIVDRPVTVAAPTASELDVGRAIVARGLVKRYGETVALAGIDLDVRDLGQFAPALDSVDAVFGQIDILDNNAGINRPLPGLEVTEDNWDDHFATNVKGGFFLAQAVARTMVATAALFSSPASRGLWEFQASRSTAHQKELSSS